MLVDAEIREFSGFAAVTVADSTGDWAVRNTTIEDDVGDGPGWTVYAAGAAGDWTVEGTVVENSGRLEAVDTEGDWEVRESELLDTDGGIGANRASGNWTVENVTVAEGRFEAISAQDATGDWAVRESELREHLTGIDASGTTGDWSVHRTTLVDNATGINATDAEPAGNARRNWWGQPPAEGGVPPGQCVGEADCANPLGEPPADDATGIEFTVTDNDGDPFEDVGVFVFDTEQTETPDWVERTAEKDYYAGDRLGDAAWSTHTGPDGIVRLTGFDGEVEMTEHVALFVPPRDQPENVEFFDFLGEADTVVEQSVELEGEQIDHDARSWHQHQNDARNSGTNDGYAPRRDVDVNWTFEVFDQGRDEGIETSPVVADGTVFFADTGGLVYAVDLVTGEEQWRRAPATDPGEAPTESTSGVAVGTQRVYVVVEDALYALHRSDGTVDWSFGLDVDLSDELLWTAPTVDVPTGTTDGLVYVPIPAETSADSEVVAVEAATGQEAWRTDTQFDPAIIWFTQPPAIHDGTAYVRGVTPGGDDDVLALDATDGTREWRASTEVFEDDDPVIERAAPMVADGTLYLTGHEFSVQAFDPATGALDQEWAMATGRGTFVESEFEFPVPMRSSHTVGDGIVYYGLGGTTEQIAPDTYGVMALDTTADEEAWAFEVTDTAIVLSSPALVEQGVYFGDTEGTVFGVETGGEAAGTELWQYDTGATIVGSPAVVEGTVYIGTTDGQLYALASDVSIEEFQTDDGLLVRTGPATPGQSATSEPEQSFAPDGVAADGTDGTLTEMTVTFGDNTAGNGYTVTTAAEPPGDVPAPAGADDIGYVVTDGSEFDTAALEALSFTVELPEADIEDPEEVVVGRRDRGGWRPVQFEVDAENNVEVTATAASFSTFVVATGRLDPPALPGFENPPRDLNRDGLFEDIDGDGELTIFDVQALFNRLDADVVQTHPEAFNFNEDDDPEEVTIFDVQGLFNRLAQWGG